MLIVLFVALSLPVMVKAEGATIWTDKGDYTPGETVTIYGSGFNPEAQVNITVTRPDGSSNEWAVTSDSSGSFTTTYLLDGITGTYTVTATDGTNTASTTFTDQPPNFNFALTQPPNGATNILQTRSYNAFIRGKSPIGGDIGSVTISFENPSTWGIPSGVTLTPPTGKSWSVGTDSNAPSAGTLKVYADPASEYEHWDSSDMARNIIGDTWRAQTFTVGGTAHYVTSVNLRLYRESGASGTLHVRIKGTDGSGHPTGVSLTGGEYAIADLGIGAGGPWVEIPVTPYSLDANTKYAIVVFAPGASGNVYWRVDSTGAYAGGNEEDSTNGGGIWTSDTSSDFTFEVWVVNELVADDELNIGFSITAPSIAGDYTVTATAYDRPDWTADYTDETDEIKVQYPPSLIYEGGSLHPTTVTQGQSVSFGVSLCNVPIPPFSRAAVTLSTSSTLSFTDGTHTYTANLPSPETIYHEINLIFATASVPSDLAPGIYTPTLYLVAEGGVDSNGAPFGPVTLTTSPNTVTVTAAAFESITVSGHKYEDTDGNRPTTSPLDGWTIELYKWDGSTWVKQGEAVTGYDVWPDGYYEFTVTEPGDYQIKEVLKDKWTETYPVLTHSPGDGSTPSVLGYSFTAESGVDVPDQDFWNFEWLTVSGYKFFDADGDGVRDAGEPGLQHWAIKLKRDDTLYGSTTIDANGYYEFTVKDPGHYTVSETLLAPWWAQTAPTPVPPGTYTFDAVSGTDVVVDFGNWLGKSIVTTSNYCWFDVEAGGERQFKLIFTPDVPDNPTLFRLTASNPGQFYYNVFYVGSLTAGQTFTISLPYPFVTQGAVPVHVYSSLNTGPTGCLIPGTDITSQFSISGVPVTIPTPPTPSYDEFGETATITVTSNGAYSGFVYITVHLDYGLKKTGGYNYNKIDLNALKGVDTIYNHVDYTFSVSGPVGDTQTVQNLNVFKRDPGFGGLVTDSTGTPVKGVRVEIYGPDGKLLATVYTDEDGWYQYNYKHTGKAATFTIKLPDYGLQQSVTLKANSFALVNFQI